jgi:hypothetical protein
LKGHWSGSIDVPQGALGVEIDLDQASGGWIGSISIPAQSVSGLPLDRITVNGGKFEFHMKGAPGDPTFKGTVAADGKTISGDFSQGPGAVPFKLTRTGDPKVETVKASSRVSAEFVGTWEGTLEAGQSLRLVLKIANGKDGAEAIMVSVDQGNAEIPVTSIEQKGAHLTLQLSMVGGSYEADINKEGTGLTGTWTQNGGNLPLTFKKSPGTKP